MHFIRDNDDNIDNSSCIEDIVVIIGEITNICNTVYLLFSRNSPILIS